MLQRKSFWFSFALMLASSFGSYLYYIQKYYGECVDNTPDNSSIYFLNGSNVSSIIVYLSLFLIVIPYANAYVLDKKNNTQFMYLSRDHKWYLKQLFVAILGAFIIIFIPAVFNIILNEITYHPNGNLDEVGMQGKYIDSFIDVITGDNILRGVLKKGYYLRRLAYFYPQLYNVVCALLYAVSGSILAGFSYSLSLYLGKIRILVYIVPFTLVFFFHSFETISYNYLPYYICMDYPQYVSAIYHMYGCYYPTFWGLHIVLLGLAVFLAYQKGKDDEL